MRLLGLFAAASLVAFALVLAGCPTPQFPKGPPPEYEDPAAPSWLDGGADRTAPPPPTTSPSAAPDAGNT